MSLLPALNDKKFLQTLIDMAHEFSRTEKARQFAAMLVTIINLIAYLRRLPYRPDLGDPDDGPRIGDLVSQRVRMPALDPNCVERTLFFLAIAILLAPQRYFTAATLMLDDGLHTFPVEVTPGWARPIILDSQSMHLRNLMTAAVYRIRNASPIADDQIVPWYAELARNASSSRGMAECYEIATRALRRALTTGTSIENPEELACLLALTEEDAQLFGPLGEVAHDRMSRSIRNLSISLDTKAVGKYLDKLYTTVEPYAGDVVKAALVAQFGPAAGFALYGKDLDLKSLTGKSEPMAEESDKDGKRKLTREERRQLMLRMSPAYFMATK